MPNSLRSRRFLAVLLISVSVGLILVAWRLFQADKLLRADETALAQARADTQGCIEHYVKDSSTVTVLTDSQFVPRPMSLFGGLLTIEQSFLGERAVPVWIVPGKLKPLIYDETAIGKPNLLYYWLDVKSREIEGPFLPLAGPPEASAIERKPQ